MRKQGRPSGPQRERGAETESEAQPQQAAREPARHRGAARAGGERERHQHGQRIQVARVARRAQYREHDRARHKRQHDARVALAQAAPSAPRRERQRRQREPRQDLQVHPVIVLGPEIGASGIAPEVVDEQPLVEEFRRALIERPWPEHRPWREGERRDPERARVTARAPCRRSGERERRETEHAGPDQAFRHEGDAGTRAERDTAQGRPLRVQGKAVNGERDAGHQRVVGDQKMRGVEIADAAHEDEQRGERLAAAVEGACAQPDESKRQRRVEARGKARGIVQRKKSGEEPGEKSRRDEKERRLLHERLAGKRRHDPVARVQDVEH